MGKALSKTDNYKFPSRHLTGIDLSVLLSCKNIYYTEQENDSDSEGNDSDSGTTVCVNRGPLQP